MKLTSELHVLVLVALSTLFMWVPYLCARLWTHGLVRALGNPDPAFQQGPAWAQRSRAAHANAIENLVVFAPIVTVAALVGVSTPTTVLASKVYLGARLLHYAVYTAGVPVVRTLAFAVGFGSTVAIAAAVLGG